MSFFVDGNNLTHFDGQLSINLCLPHLRQLGMSNNNFNCSYLTKFIHSANDTFRIVKDSENDSPEGIHVKGIACTTNGTLHPHISNPNRHDFNVHRKRPQNDLQRYQYYDKTSYDELDSQFSTLKHRNASLQTHLNVVTTFLIILCVAAFLFAIYKVIMHFRFSRIMITSNSYRSTTTMNTLQESLE